jgi:hypothetical protein
VTSLQLDTHAHTHTHTLHDATHLGHDHHPQIQGTTLVQGDGLHHHHHHHHHHHAASIPISTIVEQQKRMQMEVEDATNRYIHIYPSITR